MVDNGLEDRLIQILTTVLRVPKDRIGVDASMENTEEWTSLLQLSVLLAVEQEFAVDIEPDQAVDLVSVESLSSFLSGNRQS